MVHGQWSMNAATEIDEADEEFEVEATVGAQSFVANLISYVVGCTFGRWDVRYLTGTTSVPELPDPFAPLPVCPPGMLTDDDGLPLRKTLPNYPLRISWDGILVD